MDRRNFIKGVAAIGGVNAFVSGSPLSFKISKAHAADGKIIVSVFQRGGCDGLNTIIPFNEGRYYDIRPTIAISPPESGAGSALDLNGQFGIHPALSGLHNLFMQGQLAVMPCVQYPNASRSHFQSQHFIESGQMTQVSDGWLNRHLQTQSNNARFRAVGFGRSLAQSLRGEETAASLSSLSDYHIGLSEEEESLFLNRVPHLYQQASSSNNRRLLNRFGQKVFTDLEVINMVSAQTYLPDNGAVYSNDGFSQQLRQVAQLIKAGVGLEAATVDIGGWDTHSSQGGANGRQASALSRFSQGITAFVTDLGSLMNDVILLTSTEFGRTAHENGSLGTDHGYASTWFAIGGGVAGGIYGEWPGLGESQLRSGRFLDATIDYRDIYAEVLTQHLSNNQLATLLPNYSPQAVNLFS